MQRIAGNGTGDTRWKVPGVLDWSSMTHNPFVDITKDTTTLYASDRDVFLFLVDDTHPIEAGRLADGSPDLYFRGFYCWNSEVGSKTLGIASFYLRAVCMNRNLWGVENFEEITIRHSKFAAQRFAHEAAPALTSFANSSPAPFIAGIKAARERIVAHSDEDRESFLRKRGFSKSETAKIVETVLQETNGLGADRGAECVGCQAHDPQGHENNSMTLNELVESVRFTGGIGTVGVYVPMDPGGPDDLAKQGKARFEFGNFWFKGQHMGTGQCPVKRYNRHLRSLIAENKVKPSWIVSHDLPLEQAPEAYKHFDAREDGWTKVVLHPGQAA